MLVALTLLMSIVAGVIGAPPAHASNDTYPFVSAPCEYANGGSQCTNPNNAADKYNWYIDENGDGGFTGSPCGAGSPSGECFDNFGYQYRNCTSFVAQKINQIFAKDVHGWGNAEHWETAAVAAGYSLDASPRVGDIAQWDTEIGGGFGHVAYVASVNTNGIATLYEYNAAGTGVFGESRTTAVGSAGPADHYIHIGDIAGGSSSAGTQMFIRGDAAVFAKVGVDANNWSQETSPGNATAIAAGGSTQLFLRGDGAVFATDTVGGGWVQETDPNTASAIAVSSTGLQMIIGNDASIWAKDSIGYGGWTQEVGPGNASAIAVGGDTQMFIRGDAAIFARSGIGGSWTQEVGPGNASKIAVSSTGVQMFIRGDAAVFAKNGVGDGGWTQEVGPGNAASIAVGGNTQMFVRGDSAVFAKDSIGNGGWVQETDPGNATAIAAGTDGTQMFVRGDAAIFAKKGVGSGGWTQEVGAGNANAVAVG